MALALQSPFHLSISAGAGKRRHAFLRSSFLPSATAIAATPLTKKKKTSASPPISSVKVVLSPPLDRRTAKSARLRFVSKLQTLLLCKPRHFLPLRVLSRSRRYLSLPHTRSLLSVILGYRAVFRLFHAHSNTSPSLSLFAVSLTPAAAALAARTAALRSSLSSSLAAKLHRLLMLCRRRSLLLSKLVHLAPDLGLPPDFRSRLCNHHPNRFKILETSYGRALKLVSWDPSLASPLPAFAGTPKGDDFKNQPIIDRPPKFNQLKLRRGLNLKRRHRNYLLQIQEAAEVPLYSEFELENGSVEEMEKRACAVVREVLGMTVEKKTLVDHLTPFMKDFGLPNKLLAMLIRHPEMFYVSAKGPRDSVFLVEAYDEKGMRSLAGRRRGCAAGGEGGLAGVGQGGEEDAEGEEERV